MLVPQGHEVGRELGVSEAISDVSQHPLGGLLSICFVLLHGTERGAGRWGLAQ